MRIPGLAPYSVADMVYRLDIPTCLGVAPLTVEAHIAYYLDARNQNLCIHRWKRNEDTVISVPLIPDVALYPFGAIAGGAVTGPTG